MATDKELLELAAKAAGYRPDGSFGRGLLVVINVGEHNQSAFSFSPLTDDGDALRLAVKLFLWEAVRDGYQHVDSDNDFYAATRRAIVRAAAEIGRSMLSAEQSR